MNETESAFDAAPGICQCHHAREYHSLWRPVEFAHDGLAFTDFDTPCNQCGCVKYRDSFEHARYQEALKNRE